MRSILVTGALGQIGAELTPALRERYGRTGVIASDLANARPSDEFYERLDCVEPEAVADLVERRDIGVIYHLAALLSAAAEGRPQVAWSVNMSGLYNVLEAARRFGCKVFFPSSIAAFGPTTPRLSTPQVTIQRPTTIYGVTKVAGEMLCDYYAARFGVDARGLRLPGLVSFAAPPGGGVTDYAVEMFRAAVRGERYSCFLAAKTRLDMMYMPDAIRAIIELMESNPQRLRFRNAYNVTGMSVTPREIAAEIRKHISSFDVDYRVDPLRQAIAESWPQSLDASAAREDWGFAPRFDLAAMTSDMLAQLTSATGAFDQPIPHEARNANATLE
ncbi:MAG: NAD-dependent epimerase/dehydratase family protein [Alphaproteobacteria bacterium]|nr:NAD-dependent epimerase/dehydratase family protein [Alphaproteobacteria bacterium]